MGDIESLQEAPRTVRILNAARDEIRSQFERYRAQHIDTWDIDIDAIPEGTGWYPERRHERHLADDD